MYLVCKNYSFAHSAHCTINVKTWKEGKNTKMTTILIIIYEMPFRVVKQQKMLRGTKHVCVNLNANKYITI